MNKKTQVVLAIENSITNRKNALPPYKQSMSYTREDAAKDIERRIKELEIAIGDAVAAKDNLHTMMADAPTSKMLRSMKKQDIELDAVLSYIQDAYKDLRYLHNTI